MTTEKVLDKIRKLLAVARNAGATEGEADTAMAMASRLMLEHNIAESDVGEAEDRTVRIGDWCKVTPSEMQGWVQYLVIASGRLYHCHALTQSKSGNVLFVGRKDNIEAAEMTLVWMIEQVEELYRQALRGFGGKLDKRGRAELRGSFKGACAAKVLSRVDRIMSQLPSDGKALVVVEDVKKAEAIIDGMGAKTREVSVRRGFGQGAGWAAGDQVQLQGNVERGARRIDDKRK